MSDEEALKYYKSDKGIFLADFWEVGNSDLKMEINREASVMRLAFCVALSSRITEASQ